METGVTSAEVRIFADPEITCAALADSFTEVARQCLAGCHRFSVALSGGQTPRRLYEILAEAYRDQLPWPKLHFFFGDDRFVPHDDPDSNYKMAKEALLDHVPVPPGNIHPMPTFFQDSEEAAADYEATMKEYFHYQWPRIDLALQGLGPEGHTASLFPHSPALTERDRWVMAVEAPVAPTRRLTLTLPVLNHASRVWFLVTGADKAEAVTRALSDDTDPEEFPAAGVRPHEGELLWWLDDEAAGSICRE